jgi:hypothetical protein
MKGRAWPVKRPCGIFIGLGDEVSSAMARTDLNGNWHLNGHMEQEGE